MHLQVNVNWINIFNDKYWTNEKVYIMIKPLNILQSFTSNVSYPNEYLMIPNKK